MGENAENRVKSGDCEQSAGPSDVLGQPFASRVFGGYLGEPTGARHVVSVTVRGDACSDQDADRAGSGIALHFFILREKTKGVEGGDSVCGSILRGRSH